jgi:hypothetical protein
MKANWRPHLLLSALVGSFLLGFATPVNAGTQQAPEITDPSADQTLNGVPVGAAGQFTTADIIRGWIEEEPENLFFKIQVTGTGGSGTAGAYSWTFSAKAGAATITMGATSGSSGPTPKGAATKAELAASIITLTVPRSVFGDATVLTNLFITSVGGTPDGVQPTVAVTDTAPNAGASAGISYTIQGGGSPGALDPNDSDGDGLNDTWEMQHFGNLTHHNGTSDPDEDGLNNTAEFLAGTDPTNPDTDGDLVLDGDDEAPLDPNLPALTNTTDRDNDGLPDLWERQHFNGTMQNGTDDPDGDGLNNSAEFALGTDPTKADTDGDGVDDLNDIAPLDPTLWADSVESGKSTFAKPELYAGSLMFATAGTLCLLGLARFL